ncbi:MAG: DUF2232 domain-containing protein [Cocleimonas sp.]|nr:DUF2232 domain-containing protein [Cocleimonas sp.]
MASFIMAGRGQAAFFIILSTLLSLILPPVGVFSAAAIALITLRISWQQGLLYTFLGSAILAIVSYLLKQDAPLGVIAGLIAWLPIVFFATILAQTGSWQRTLQALLAVTMIGVLLFHAYQPEPALFWQTTLEQLKPMLQEAYKISSSEADTLIQSMSSWMTGVFIAAIAVTVALALVLARHWQAMLYNPGGFGEEFRQLRIGKVFALIIVACIVLAIVMRSTIAIEILIIAVGIFMLQGIALAHGVVHQLEMKPGWLVALYILLFILLAQMFVLLAAFGIIDNFVDFRRKIAKTDQQ